MFGFSYPPDFEAELFARIDQGVDVSECVKHPYFTFTPHNIVGHSTRGIFEAPKMFESMILLKGPFRNYQNATEDCGEY